MYRLAYPHPDQPLDLTIAQFQQPLMSLDMDQLQYSLIKHDAVEGNPTKEPIKQPNASHGPSESKEAIEL